MRWIEIKIAGDVRWIPPRVNAPLDSMLTLDSMSNS
jgi:hypothetical protein